MLFRSLTGAGIGIGTPDYMSPEQGLGKGVDERSDMYSLAVVLYELVTGVRPFVGDTPVEIIMNHVKQPLPDPRRVVPSLPEDAVAFFERALARDAKDRYPTMDDFLRDLYGLRLGSQLRDSTRLHQPKSTPMTELSVHRPPAKTSGQPPASTKGRKSPIGWIAAGAVLLALGFPVPNSPDSSHCDFPAFLMLSILHPCVKYNKPALPHGIPMHL